MDNRHDEWGETYGNIGCTASVLAEIPIDVLVPWVSLDGEGQPFKLYSDAKMQELADNIAEHGIIEPICVRPLLDGKYQIIAGHNRVYAAQLAGLRTVPASVKAMSDDEAAIRMVDSNLQHRETILPSELARAYKVKLDALGSRQGQRNDLTSDPVDWKLGESAALVGVDMGTSAAQVRRYLRLLNLIPELLDLVDCGKMKMRPAIELSYLTAMEQSWVIETITTEGVPTTKQATELKKQSKAGTLTQDSVLDIFLDNPKKESGSSKVTFKVQKLRKYFPGLAAEEIEASVIEILEAWSKERKSD